MDKIKKAKEALKKIKSGIQTLKNLPGEIKQLITEIVMKKVLLVVTKYVLIPLLIIGLLITLFYGIFAAILQAIMKFIGGVISGVKFFIGGRSAQVTGDQVKAARAELERSGVDFDEIGFLGEEYLEEDENAVDVDISGFTASDGNSYSGSDAIGDGDTKILLEYAKFLQDKMKEENIQNKVIFSKGESGDSKKSRLKQYNGEKVLVSEATSIDSTTGEVLSAAFYTVHVDDADGNFTKLDNANDYYSEYNKIKTDAILWYIKKCYEAQSFTFSNYNTLNLDLDIAAGFEKLNIFDINLSNSSWSTFLSDMWDDIKDALSDPDTYWDLFKGWFNFFDAIVASIEGGDGNDDGGIIMQFYGTTDSYVGDEFEDAVDNGKVGFWQKQFYYWTHLYQGEDASFAVLYDETTGDNKGRFYGKINNNTAEDIDITDYVYEYAMPWTYPFAFHNSTLAPDIGFLVSRLGIDHHRLRIQMWNIGSKIVDLDNDYNRNTINYLNVSGEEAITNYDDNIIAKKVDQNTWYMEKHWEYTQTYVDIPVGRYFEMELHKFDVDVTPATYDEETGAMLTPEVRTPTNERILNTKRIYYMNGTTSVPTILEFNAETALNKLFFDSTPIGAPSLIDEITTSTSFESNVNEFDYYKVLPDKSHEVVERVDELVEDYSKSYERKNEDGIKDMNKIMESLPSYEYDATTGTIKLKDLDSLKYYYTANTFTEQTGTFGGKNTKGKSILNTPTNARSIVDALYDIYDDSETKTYEAKQIEYSKEGDDALTTDEMAYMLKSDYDGEKDYTLAHPLVKEAICYFYDMGALEGDEFVGAYAQAMVSLTDAAYDTWPLEQEEKDYEYDETNGFAKIKCGPNTSVLASTSGVLTYTQLADGTYTVMITSTINVELEGETKTVDKVVYIKNVESIATGLASGDSVSAGDVIGTASEYIIYSVTEGSEEKNIKTDLAIMKEAANSDFESPIRSDFRFSAYFGKYPNGGDHWGLDFACGKGTPIYASKGGTVVVSGLCARTEKNNGGWGEYVKIDHGGGTYTLYGHMLTGSRLVKVGDKVLAGQQIGSVNSTGNSSGNHLHFEIYIGGPELNKRVDPLPYLKGEVTLNKKDDTYTPTTSTGSTQFAKSLHSYEGTGGGETSTQYRVYYDDYGYLTVGYGVTFKDNKQAFLAKGINVDNYTAGDYIDKDIVDSIENDEIDTKRRDVINELKKEGITNLKDYQIDALVMRCYQLGLTGGLSLTPKYERNGRTFAEAYKEFGNTQALGDNYMLLPESSLAGLVKRRQTEWKMFHEGIYTENN